MPGSRSLRLFLVLVMAATLSPIAAPISNAKDTELDAATILDRAVMAMGGTDHFTALGAANLQVGEIRYMVEQSERPGGPWLTQHTDYAITRDLTGPRTAMTVQSSTLPAADNLQYFPSLELRYDGTSAVFRRSPDDDWRGAPHIFRSQIVFYARYLPVALLTRLEDRADVTRLADEKRQGRRHLVLGFAEDGGRAKLYIDPDTFRLTAVEVVGTYPGDVMLNLWGDVTTLIEYSMWWATSEGLHYPRQIDVTLNGQPSKHINITALTFGDADGRLDFEISDDLREQSAASERATVDGHIQLADEPQELAPGILQFTGAWNTTLVEQEDGVYVIEGVVSSAFGAATIARAGALFPEKKIRGVITTSDAWPHIGGLRAFIAHKIPVIYLDLNVRIISRLLTAPFSLRPDELATNPQLPAFRRISEPVTFGDGANRMTVIPVRGEIGERMMVVYFPARRLLYASDLAQLDGDGNWYPFSRENAFDLIRVVCREGLDVDQFFAMHYGLAQWDDTIRQLGLDPGDYCRSMEF